MNTTAVLDAVDTLPAAPARKRRSRGRKKPTARALGPNGMLTLSQAAARMHFTRQTVTKYCGKGLQYTRIGRMRFFRPEWIDEFLVRLTRGGATPSTARRRR